MNPEVKLLSITPNYQEVLKTACSKPYGKNISLDGIIKRVVNAGHTSVLEHCYASFEIKCSVAVLGQLTRHRHLSFTCKSARGSLFDDFVLPFSMASQNNKINEAMKEQAIKLYSDIIASGASLDEARYFLPQGVGTDIVVTGNFRAWYEYLPKRVCNRAMAEHHYIALKIAGLLADACPEVFDRSFYNCKDCKELSCSFGKKVKQDEK